MSTLMAQGVVAVDGITSPVVAKTGASLQVAVIGIGVLGPGLADWASAQTLLRDASAWQNTPTVVPAPQRLPATERRRAGVVVKASIVVADEALLAAGLHAAELATVFTSSTGDPANCHILCEALAAPERLVSPTRFTNSVHNAPAGYWHIAAASRAPSTSLAAFDASFAAGLLEAAVQCQATQAPVLLVACDVPYPEPLHTVRPVADVFAVALVLAPARSTNTGRRLSLAVTPEMTETPCHHPALDAVRQGIPAARALPLLRALAGAGGSELVLQGLPGMALQLTVAPP
jgi:Beta-ketoacyl synthase, N-terminal domain